MLGDEDAPFHSPIFPGASRPANENTAERSVHECTDAFFCVYTNTIVTLWTAHMKKCKIKTDRISTELILYRMSAKIVLKSRNFIKISVLFAHFRVFYTICLTTSHSKVTRYFRIL